MKNVFKIFGVILLILLIFITNSCKKDKAALPVITSTALTRISSTMATSGGDVTLVEGVPIVSYGVCWNTSTSPTIDNSRTNESGGLATFICYLGPLIPNTVYHIRAYATNKAGVGYGNEVIFKTAPVSIGDTFLGGKMAYSLQPADPNYVAGETHGLIASPSDQSTGIAWWIGSFISTGATATALGTGNSNTTAILANSGIGNIAAKLCSDLDLGGYSDWYLPSKDELNKLHLNYSAIGGFISDHYWSSSEWSTSNDAAWSQGMIDGNQFNTYKYVLCRVRAIRAF